MIRSSKFCKRYDYVRFDLHTPIIYPPNGQAQVKTGYKFYVDTTSEVSPMDIYNAYIEMDFKITKLADNTGFPAADLAGTINGNNSLINKLECDFGGAMVVNTPTVNHAINLKNVVEFSQEYSDKVGPSMFWYPDTNVGAVAAKYVAHVGGTAADNPAYNKGFASRMSLLTALAEVNTIYPLNRFGFVEAFEDRVLPNGKMIFTITLESDDNVIWRDAGADPARFVVTKMVLWVPKMLLNVAGEKILLEKYLTNRSWTYLKEKMEVSPVLRVRNGVFRITSAIQNPKHLFIWFLNANKLNSQVHNMFLYNTFNIANGRTIVDCQVEVNSGNYYPQVRLNPTSELERTYRRLINYTKAFNDTYGSPLIDSAQFRRLYGVLYFDLSGQEDNMRDENVKLEFRFTLNNNPNADYHICFNPTRTNS